MNYPGTTSSQTKAPATTSHREDDEKTPCPMYRERNHPAMRRGETEQENAQPATRDFYLDTHFNPTWTHGPNVFSHAKDGTIVRPEVYAQELYPGYHNQTRSVRGPTSAYGTAVSKDPKWWKNVAITEHDDAEFEALEARKLARVKAVEEQEQRMYDAYYGHPRRYAYGQGPYGAQPQSMYPYPPPLERQ